MPTSHVARMLDLAKNGGAPEGTTSDLFLKFVQSAGPQLRSAFMERHTIEQMLAVTEDLFLQAQQRKHDQPVVMVRANANNSRIITRMPDQPFIVDTVLLCLRNLNVQYQAGFNLVISIGRDSKGQMVSIDGDGDQLESIIYVETDAIEPEQGKALETSLDQCLSLAQATVSDFTSTTKLIASAARRLVKTAGEDDNDEARETAALLRWLASDNFVFMATIQGDTRLGMARAEMSSLWSDESLEDWATDGPMVQIRKGKEESRVHRAGRKDEIRICLPDGDALLLQGLFTYRAVTQPGRHVPLLRQVLEQILNGQDSKPGSYRYKGIRNVFDSLPTEFLFTTSSTDIAAMIDRVLEAEQEQRARSHILQNPNDSTTFVLSAIPRGQWSEQVRSRTQDLLVEAMGASYCDHGVFSGRYQTMLVHYYLTGTQPLDDAEANELAKQVMDQAARWQDRLQAALGEQSDAATAEALVQKYANAFENLYLQMTNTEQMVRDIELLEAVSESNRVLVDLFVDGRGRVNLRIYQLRNILLSEMLPVLDNFGLVVVDQFADPVTPREGTPCTIDTFRLQGVRDFEESSLVEHTADLIEGIEAVFTQQMADDALNHLLLSARIPWTAVDMIRAYLGYARQLGLPYTRSRLKEIMLAQPELVQGLWNYFHARFDPGLSGDRTKAMNETKENFEARLRGVRHHDQDITFRTLFNLIESTLRTNFYRTDRIEHYLSLKIDCNHVWQMPEPRMRYEIYVHHREMEGVHLRGGDIARGGIRWSDREDYRREIHGLATTQMVKNVLIVPQGAKGGFYLKNAAVDRGERRAQADVLYTILIRGLLDLTDNIVEGEIIHPEGVVRHDGDDPYLVVAADKGTAHLSDTANGVAREYGFWLDDAFASGGSNGYDHKKVGITARGAWMTARRHFAEMGLDPMKEPFTCVAIGDPAGDVFGNGVIETPHMKLVAAFNHRHVFIDPDPDPKTSYKERLRLFKAVSGWEGYNTDLISKGGGIFSREAKSIRLTDEIKELLGVMSDELSVDAVIRLILRLDVHLLWNGGIGTYVKASHETHQDVGDATNDPLRINADELRCKIVAEGGNLGLTQAGRVEYALNGGRINNDAIDNSGGVDMSDHEVNLKILLNPVVERGQLSNDERNDLLERLTEIVASLVLDNSDTHANQLSLDQIRSVRDPLFFSRTIDWACRRSKTTRAALTLPSDDDLSRRAQARKGLTRPELAVLSAHVKTHVFDELMNAEEAEIPDFEARVRSYFPPEIQKSFGEGIPTHMLSKAIGMTLVNTDVVGDSGVIFFPMVSEWTGASSVAIARAWILTMDLVKANQIRAELDACSATFEAKYKAWIDVQSGIAGLCALALSPGESGLVDEPIETIREVLRNLGRIQGAAHQEQLRFMAEKHIAREIPAPLAHRIAALSKLSIAREISLLHDPSKRLSHTIIRYISIGEATGILPALRTIRIQQTSGPWDPVALAILRTRFFSLMRQLYTAINIGPEVRLGVNRVRRRLVRRGPLVSLSEEMSDVLKGRPDAATLLVAEERIRAALADGTLSQASKSNGKPVKKTRKSSRKSGTGRQGARGK